MAIRGVLLLCLISPLAFGQLVRRDNYVLDISKDSCTTEKDGSAQYFDAVTLACKQCHQNSTFQKTTSDGLSCECKPGYRLTNSFGGDKVFCAPCAENQVVSTDGWECKECAANSNADTCKCAATRTITVERELNGVWAITSPQQQDKCTLCQGNTVPNAQKDRCVRCSDDLNLGFSACEPSCPTTQQAGGYCFPSNVQLLAPDLAFLFKIPRIDGTASTNSQYFTAHLRAAEVLCKEQDYQNATACQVLANLCVLTLYNEQSGRICSYIRQDPLLTIPRQILYYDNDPEDVIESTDIPDSYTLTPPMTIPFKAMVYSLDGQFLRRADLTGGLLQLCDSTDGVADAAYTFGTYYSYSCKIKALGLWNQVKYPLEFFDIFLKYQESGQDRLFKVPVLFTELRDDSDDLINTGEMPEWRITRRMFLVDNQMSIPDAAGSVGGEAGTVADYVRYAKDITLHITLQDDTKDGKIKIPYFEVSYADVSRALAEDGADVEVSFSVSYTMSWSSFRRDFQIATGTLGTLATLYAGYRTWVWSKRAGRPSIDFPSIVNFILLVASSLSNVFFVITFGIAFYWFIFFKRQDVVYLVHPEGNAVNEWLGLLGAAFALRCLSLLHTMVVQCSADIFLVDWERPRGLSSTQDGKKTSAAPVSIWRTYFVANEWNELQGLRKISPTLQIFSVCFFLVVVGFEKTTTKDPDGSVEKSSSDYQAAQSYIYRYALAVLVYIIVAVVQWIFFTFIYERFVEDKVQQFVDLCSMSNVSVFVMAHAQFGYYIHGRSVHGKADTNMREMAEMMKREEEDLCGKRGLVPDTEEQTFIMTLPKRLRIKYEQVYLPAALENAGAVGRMEQGKAGGRLAGSAKEKSIEAYNMLNKFLCAFIDHSLKDVDYVVKDKTFLESIMDTEFFDTTEKGIFYKDNGHSFDQVLFYGNEMSLILFDTLLFCVVDLIWQNYLLDGVIVFLVTSLVTMIRDTAGRKNLARKTLVDERFLI